MPSGLVMPSADQFIFYALGASILVHAVLLAIQFRAFDPARLKDRMPPLEVALVNAKSNAKPPMADILAQANLDGGGNTDASAAGEDAAARAAQGERHRRDRRSRRSGSTCWSRKRGS